MVWKERFFYFSTPESSFKGFSRITNKNPVRVNIKIAFTKKCCASQKSEYYFLLKSPTGRPKLNHVAFTVRDIHEVFGGGLHISRQGWETQLGPGRHPISSAYFWYVNSPCGGLAEYYADEDYLTENWQPRNFERKPELFAEWAVIGGFDGITRRQKTDK